jgi:ribose-phosphate pyrophosphokinase
LITLQEAEAMVAEAEARLAKKYLQIARAPRPIKVFGLNGTKDYAKKIVSHLNIELTPHEEKMFEDGEPYIKPTSDSKGNVRGHNVFIIQSLYADDKETVSDKFMKLCIMAGACAQARAHEVTAVIPHLAWARQDRKTRSREPITTKIVARMLQAAGVHHVLMMDCHNLSAEQNAFDTIDGIGMDNLECKNLFADWCCDRIGTEDPIVVLTPDGGGLLRADRFRVSLMKRLAAKHGKPINVGIAIYDKLRRATGELTGGKIVGGVEGAQVIMIDDMFSTGGTATKACKVVKKFGGKMFAMAATHGLFVGKANQYLQDFDCPIVVADTIGTFRLNESNKAKLHVVDTTSMCADAIHRIHTGTGSISELLI